MSIVLAPDSFKESLSAIQVAQTMQKAIQTINKNEKVFLKPMADGGEGTVDSLLLYSGGDRIQTTCIGPLGNKIKTYYGILHDKTAVIEVANISGLDLIPPTKRNPNVTTSYGIGEIIKDALDKGCKSIIVGLGGSSTIDGGLGMLNALGVKMLDKNQKQLNFFGEDLLKIADVDFSNLDPRLIETNIKVISDVKNSLYGTEGASFIFGPQKGATLEQVYQYDKSLKKFAEIVSQSKQTHFQYLEGSGAAGGLGFALLILGAKLHLGSQYIAKLAKLEEAIKISRLVITGEGRSDEQTLYGKAPGYVADVAKRHNRPILLISGSIGRNSSRLNEKFDAFFSIINQPLSTEESIKNTYELLYNFTKQLFKVYMLPHSTKN